MSRADGTNPRARGENPRARGENPRQIDPLRDLDLLPEELRELPYALYRRTKHWKALRKLVHERAAGRCEGCGAKGRTDTHHTTYERLGEEHLEDLIALCRSCHAEKHKASRTLRMDGAWLRDQNGRVLGRVTEVVIELPGGTFKEGVRPTENIKDSQQLEGGVGETSPDGPREIGDVEKVWDHYVQLFDATRQTLNPQRRRDIRAALKVSETIARQTEAPDPRGEAVTEVKLAISGLRVSPHHNGENDQRKKYLDIRYALRGNTARGESVEERLAKMIALGRKFSPHSDGHTSVPDAIVQRLLDSVRHAVQTGGEIERGKQAKARLEGLGYQVRRQGERVWLETP